MQKNVRNPMLVIITVLAVLALSGLLLLENRNFEDMTVANAQQLLLSIAKANSKSIETYISDLQGDLGVIADNPVLQQAAADNISYEEVIRSNGHSPLESSYKHFKDNIHGLYRLDSKGIILSKIPWDESKLGGDYSNKPGVKTVIETHKPFISELFVSNSGKKCFSVCQPVFRQGEFVGIVRAVVYLQTIREMAIQIKVGEKGYVQILDDDGYLIAHPADEQVGKDIMTTRKKAFPGNDWSDLQEIVNQMKSGKTGTGIYRSAWWQDEDTEIVKKLTAFVPIRIGNELWSLGVVMDYDEISGPVKAHLRNTVAGMLIVLLILIISGCLFFQLQKQKTILAAEAASADKLQEINQKLSSEITKRARSEEDLEKIFNMTNYMVCVATIDGKFIRINSSFEKILGYSTEELLSRPFLKLIHPEDLDGTKEVIQEKLAQGHKVISFENRYRCKDGSYKWLSWTSQPVPEKNITYAIAYDITRKKKTEQELKFRLEFENLISNISTDFINIPSQDIEEGIDSALESVGQFIDADRSYVFEFDKNKKFVSNTYEWCREGIVPEIQNLSNIEIDRELPYFSKIIRKKEVFHVPSVEDMPIEAKNEKEHFKAQNIKALVVVPMIFQNSIIGFVGFDSVRGEKEWQRDSIFLLRTVGVIIANALEKKKAEEKLEKNQDRLARSQQLGLIGTWNLDIVNNVLEWTDQNFRNFGVEPATAMDYEKFISIVHPDDRDYVDEKWNAAMQGQEYDIEHRIVVNGKTKWLREKAEIKFDKEGNALSAVGISQDITNSKNSEYERENLLKTLNFKNDELQSVMYTVSHDLKAPLVNIAGFSDMLKQDCQTISDLLKNLDIPEDTKSKLQPILDDNLPESLNFINASVNSMKELLDGLLQVSRIGSQDMCIERLDMNEIMDKIKESLMF